jgi:hypothetical protein
VAALSAIETPSTGSAQQPKEENDYLLARRPGQMTHRATSSETTTGIRRMRMPDVVFHDDQTGNGERPAA